MKFVLICFLAVFTATYANENENHFDLAQIVAPMLAEFQNTEFERTTVALINLQLQASNKTKKAAQNDTFSIIGFLENLVKKNKQETKEETEAIEKTRTTLGKQLINLRAQKLSLESKIKAYTEEDDILKDERKDKEESYSDDKGDLEEAQAALPKVQATLNKENRKYLIRSRHYKKMIPIYDDAIRLLNSMLHGDVHDKYEKMNSFVQLHTGFGAQKEKLYSSMAMLNMAEDHVRLLQLQGLMAIFNQLSNSAKNQLNFEQFNQIVKLLMTLKKGDQMSLQKETAAHKKIAKKLEAEVKDLQETISDLTKSTKKLKRRLVEIRIRLDKLEELLKNGKKDLKNTNDNLRKTTATLKEENKDFKNEQAMRDLELTALTKLIAIFKEKLAPLLKKLKDIK